MTCKAIALLSLLAAAAPTSASIRGASTTYNKLDRVQNNAIQHSKQHQRDLRHHKIIGGDEATEDRYSYAVSLNDDWGHFCGGSMIARDVVLSAAHCQGGQYQVTVGRHGLTDEDGETIDVETEIPHPDYDDMTTDNDFMLVFLKDSATVDIKMVQVNSDASVPEVGDPVTVVGWGDTDISEEEMELPIYLQEVEVNAMSNEECKTSDGPYGSYEDSGGITDNMLCAREEGGGEDSCQGDSGGPLVIRGEDPNGADDIQVGVVSWGFGCAMAEYPGVYARLSSQYDWIRTTVCENSKSDHGFNCDDVPEIVNETYLPEDAVAFVDAITSTADNDMSTGAWTNVLSEGFTSGYGAAFDHVGNDARHYPVAESKEGVVLIGGGAGGKSTFQSHKLVSDDGAHSFFKITATVRATQMEQGDDFCIEFQGNNEQSGQKCWRASHELQNDEWATVTYQFDAVAVDELEVRLRIDAADEDNAGLFIDEIIIDAE